MKKLPVFLFAIAVLIMACGQPVGRLYAKLTAQELA